MPDPGGAPRPVLIVEDEPDLLESTARLIESLGYRAVRCDEPGRILDIVEREAPGVVLLDLRMPGLNVAGTLATMRSHTSGAELPVIFFSPDREAAQKAARHGAWGYLTTPFSKPELAHLLGRAFDPEEIPLDAASVRRDLRRMLHQEWDLIAAIANYRELAATAPDEAARREHLARLDDALLKLEARTERLQTYVLALADALEPVGRQPEEPAARRHR